MNVIAIIFDRRVSGTTKSRLDKLRLILPMPISALEDASEIYGLTPLQIFNSLQELTRFEYLEFEDDCYQFKEMSPKRKVSSSSSRTSSPKSSRVSC
jgi:hypothetical protein